MRKDIRGCPHFVGWLPPCWKACHLCVLFCHLRGCREWSPWCCFFKVWHTGWNTFLAATMTQLISLSFLRTCILTCALHEHQNGTTFLGENKLVPFFMALRKAFRKTEFALRAIQPENLHVCDACLRFLPSRTKLHKGLS